MPGVAGQGKPTVDKMRAMTEETKTRLWVLLTLLLLIAVIVGGVWRYGYRQALDGLARQSSADLALASDRLTVELQRFGELAVLTTDRPEILMALNSGDNSGANARLLEIADKTTALELALLDRSGALVASARQDVVPGIAQASSVRRAMQGALGWQNGLWTKGRRAFHYAAPVFGVEGRVDGVLVVAVDLDFIELDWVGTNPAMFFTDRSGQVFVTNRSGITFWQRGPQGLQPPGQPTLPFSRTFLGPNEVWQIDWDPYLPEQALHVERPLPVIGFVGEALVDVRPARRLASLQAASVAGLCLAFGALLFLAMERRRTLAEANALLEARVTERTRALSDANTALRREVQERTRAQDALAQAQADLVQAGKLGALGQMSAGISHELNQPLMAIQTYADNGLTFFERGKPEAAQQNLGHISEMARRMGRIIRNLRAFARQESAAVERVDVVKIVDTALDLTKGNRERGGVTLEYTRPEHSIWVQGGEVRLGQVFVNLITNAVDAMQASPEKYMRIGIDEGERLTVRISDTGPGIDMPDKVFEPFYSTKTDHESAGMGLGLSISYGIVQSFGGDIRGRNDPDGATFIVTLERHDQEEEHAA